MTGERWIEHSTGRYVRVVARERTPNGQTIYQFEGNDQQHRLRHPDFNAQFTQVVAEDAEVTPLAVTLGTPEAGSAHQQVAWRVVPRREWHYGYENGDEQFGSALGEIRKELGFEDNEAFSAWLYEEGTRVFGQSSGTDVPPVLLDAFEFPALGWSEMMYVVEMVAKAIGVSPGTLLDELWLRASRCDVYGKSTEED